VQSSGCTPSITLDWKGLPYNSTKLRLYYEFLLKLALQRFGCTPLFLYWQLPGDLDNRRFMWAIWRRFWIEL
jgi:hypothetical protein